MSKKEKAVVIVITADLIAIAVKFTLASVTGSLALLADAWHSCSDLVTSVFVLLAIRADRLGKASDRKQLSGKQPSFFRSGAWEQRASGLIGILLFYISLGVFYKAFLGTGLEGIRYPLFAAAITAVLMIISYLRFRFEISVGKEQDSPALVADGYHARVDMYVLTLVLISLVGEKWGFSVDRGAAVLIGILILLTAGRLIRQHARIWFKEGQAIDPSSRSREDTMLLGLKEWIVNSLKGLQTFLLRWKTVRDRRLRIKALHTAAGGLGLLVVLIYLCSGIYIVGPREEAVVELWGKPINRHQPYGPGLRYFFPYPLGKVHRLDTRSVKRLKVGFESAERQGIILWTNIHYLKEYPLLAGDNTFIDVAAHIHYRVADPGDYLYSSSSPEELLEKIVYDSLRAEVGRREFFPSITNERRTLERKLLELTEVDLHRLKLGIELIDIFLKDLHPPLEVAFAFEDVVSAQEDRETFLEEARGYEKEQLPAAKGEAYALRQQGKQFAEKNKLLALGKASAFSKLARAVSSKPKINDFRLRAEALEKTLAGTSKYVIDGRKFKYPLDLLLSGERSSGVKEINNEKEDIKP